MWDMFSLILKATHWNNIIHVHIPSNPPAEIVPLFYSHSCVMHIVNRLLADKHVCDTDLLFVFVCLHKHKSDIIIYQDTHTAFLTKSRHLFSRIGT